MALTLSVAAQRPDPRGADHAPKPGEAIPKISVVTLKGQKRGVLRLSLRKCRV